MPEQRRIPAGLLAVLLCTLGSPAGCAASPPPIEVSCRTPLSPAVTNSCVVTDQTLWRGARPDASAAKTLIDLGVKTIVSLELLGTDRDAFESAVPDTVEPREIQYFQVKDWEPLAVIAPSLVDRHVAHFLAIARTQPVPIFIHCRSGQNRTGIMVAAYRVFNGADIEETVLEMEKYGGFWSKPDAAYIRTLTPERRVLMERQIVEWISKLRRSARITCSGGKCTVSVDAEA
jgi:Tyrosine phosphatase family